MDPIIIRALSSFPHQPEWLATYLEFLEDTQTPGSNDTSEAHHILPVSLFPEFSDFRDNPWNRVDLFCDDHLLVHYYLCKAFPDNLQLRSAFCFMTGIQTQEPSYSSETLAELAQEYAYLRSGLRWVVRGDEEAKILPSEQEVYLAKGWKFGRKMRHSPETRARISASAIAAHAREAQRPDAYSYMPRGENHHSHINGCPPEVRAKISLALQGRVQSAETIHKRVLKMIGRHWQWSQEAKEAQSQRMQGPGNNRYGKVGYWATHRHSLASRLKQSATMRQRNQEDPELRFKGKHSGADHHYWGKTRDAETCQKISQSLTGKVQSDATKQKRSESLRAAKLPQFTPEEEAVFHQLCECEPQDRARIRRLIPSSNTSAYTLVTGLCIILEGKQDEKPSRYWRTAQTWMQSHR